MIKRITKQMLSFKAQSHSKNPLDLLDSSFKTSILQKSSTSRTLSSFIPTSREANIPLGQGFFWILLQQEKNLIYTTKKFFQISPPVVKYVATHSPIQSRIYLILADEGHNIQASLLFHEEGGRNSCVPPCYLLLPIQSKKTSRRPPWHFPTAPHTNKNNFTF